MCILEGVQSFFFLPGVPGKVIKNLNFKKCDKKCLLVLGYALEYSSVLVPNQKVKNRGGNSDILSGPDSQDRCFWLYIFGQSKVLADGSICA